MRLPVADHLLGSALGGLRLSPLTNIVVNIKFSIIKLYFIISFVDEPLWYHIINFNFETSPAPGALVLLDGLA